MIPKIIHQTWETLDLPAHLVPFRQSIISINPSYDVRLYDSRMRREYVAMHMPELLPTFDKIRLGVAEADFWRMVAIYVEGGFYADLDMECLKPIDIFAETKRALFTIEAQVMPQRQRELGYELPFQIANCMFGAPPGNLFVKSFIDKMVDNISKIEKIHTDCVEDTTGPRALTRLFYDLKCSNVAILKQIYWVSPNIYFGIPLLSKNIHFFHHFAGAWKPKRAKPSLRRQIIERHRLPPPFPRSLHHDFGWGG